MNYYSKCSLLSPKTGLITLFIILFSLIGKCTAQTNFVVTIVPVILIVAVIVCFCCCVCIACICNASKRRDNASKFPAQASETNNNHEEHHLQSPYSHNQLQGYVPPTARVLYSAQGEQNSSQAETAMTEPLEPVALPDAILHEGDAPPGYEEALRMTSANPVDSAEQ